MYRLPLNCCELGKTGPDCEGECKYYDDDLCLHPDVEKDEGKSPLCGHLCC